MKINMREVMEAKTKLLLPEINYKQKSIVPKAIGKQSKEVMLYLEKSKQLLMVKLVITSTDANQLL